MRNLPQPDEDDKSCLDDIISEKNAPNSNYINVISDEIKAAYDAYQQNRLTLEQLEPIGLDGNDKNGIQHAYSVKTASFKKMCANILHPDDVEDFDECPYCGIGDPSTLDHYLPKETYPEFSVYSGNLIPICSTCNSSYKKTKFKSENNRRLFIHTYFDVITDFNFINLTINVREKIELQFHVVSDAENLDFSALINSHFLTLALDKRFKIKAVAEISRKRSTLKRIYENNHSFEDVSTALRTEATDLAESRNVNHWKAVLYKALSQNIEFCDRGFLKKCQ